MKLSPLVTKRWVFFLLLALFFGGKAGNLEAKLVIPEVPTVYFYTQVPGKPQITIGQLFPKTISNSERVKIVLPSLDDPNFFITVYRSEDQALAGRYRMSIERNAQAVSSFRNSFSDEQFRKESTEVESDNYIFDRNGDGRIQVDKDEYPCVYDFASSQVDCLIGNLLVSAAGQNKNKKLEYKVIQQFLFELPTDILLQF